MAIYLVTGKLRSGKTLACVGRIRDALLDGKRVATNLDLDLCAMLPKRTPLRGEGAERRNLFDVVRLPDKPSVSDLESIGPGWDGPYDEDKNGLLVLDELGAWLNTRTFQDKARMPVIDWLLHSGKKQWDVYFIIQHQNMIDKQVREGLAEFLVTCKRLDRMRIPVVGRVAGLVGVKAMMPKIHVGSVRYGIGPDAMVSDTWIYRGRDLYAAYDTKQIFTDERSTERFVPSAYEEIKGQWQYNSARIEGEASGPYSLLSPWHLKGRYQPAELGFLERLQEVKRLAIDGPQRPKLTPKPKHYLVALLMGLPAEQRVKHMRRLESLGAFVDRHTGGGGALVCT